MPTATQMLLWTTNHFHRHHHLALEGLVQEGLEI